MARYREPPKCPICGEIINGAYLNIPNFYGDTFIEWDWGSHNKVCESILRKKKLKKLDEKS